MQVEINKQKHELIFGFKFIREINRRLGAEIDVDGQPFNTRTGGLNFVYVGLESGDPSVVADVIVAATNTARKRPTQKEVEEYINSLLVTDVDEYLCFVSDLKKALEEDATLAGLAKVAEILEQK